MGDRWSHEAEESSDATVLVSTGENSTSAEGGYLDLRRRVCLDLL